MEALGLELSYWYNCRSQAGKKVGNVTVKHYLYILFIHLSNMTIYFFKEDQIWDENFSPQGYSGSQVPSTLLLQKPLNIYT